MCGPKFDEFVHRVFEQRRDPIATIALRDDIEIERMCDPHAFDVSRGIDNRAKRECRHDFHGFIISRCGWRTPNTILL
jgi:hypothetical protein